MKKDVVIALISGFFIGSVLAVIAISSPKIISFFKTETKTAEEKTIISPTPVISKISLVVESPKNEDIINEKSVKIEGKTQPANLVVLESGTDTKAQEADKDGKFSQELAIGEGVNQIYITSINKDGEEEEMILSLFQSFEKL